MLIHSRSNLRASILSTFSALLFFSFAMVGVAFNLAINQYIKSNAIAQLNYTRSNLSVYVQNMNMDNMDSTYPELPVESDQSRNLFRMNLGIFILDGHYQLLFPSRVSPDAQPIADTLRDANANLSSLTNRRVNTAERQYYITVSRTTLIYNDNERLDIPIYMIYYVDITELMRFTGSVNLLLLSLVGAIWLVSVGVTTILAWSISRPIRHIRMFAERIGNGDFSPSSAIYREAEFVNLNLSLNRTAKQLAQYDNEQKTFFQNVSHELRTPLMSIKCYAEGIQYGLMDPLKASQTILKETDRLTEMVDDILYVSRIDNITLPQMEKTDLRILAETCVRQQQAVAENKNVKLLIEMDEKPVTVSCISKHVARAVNNLISNAIRYAEEAVTVSCRANGKKAVISVTDDGPGLNPELMSHLFERFYKGNGGHHGIGLSIVKSVAEQHAGAAEAANGEKGAVFTITLPRESND